MEVSKHRANVSIHDQVQRLVAERGVTDGLALVNAMHITAGVIVMRPRHPDGDQSTGAVRSPISVAGKFFDRSGQVRVDFGERKYL